MNHEESGQAIVVDAIIHRCAKVRRGAYFIEPGRLMTTTLDRTATISGCRNGSDNYGL